MFFQNLIQIVTKYDAKVSEYFYSRSTIQFPRWESTFTVSAAFSNTESNLNVYINLYTLYFHGWYQ